MAVEVLGCASIAWIVFSIIGIAMCEWRLRKIQLLLERREMLEQYKDRRRE